MSVAGGGVVRPIRRVSGGYEARHVFVPGERDVPEAEGSEEFARGEHIDRFTGDLFDHLLQVQERFTGVAESRPRRGSPRERLEASRSSSPVASWGGRWCATETDMRAAGSLTAEAVPAWRKARGNE